MMQNQNTNYLGDAGQDPFEDDFNSETKDDIFSEEVGDADPYGLGNQISSENSEAEDENAANFGQETEIYRNPFAVNNDNTAYEDENDNAADEWVEEADAAEPVAADENNVIIAQESEPDDSAVIEDILVPKAKIVLMKKLLENIKENTASLESLLGPITVVGEERIAIGQRGDNAFAASKEKEAGENGTIIEGVFDGENMIGPDGKQYGIPANYASKSKLVEGDILKLTITNNGAFVYKQIGPIERERIVGLLEKIEDGSFVVIAGQRRWKILTASVTYYHGDHGDEVILLVPKGGESRWGAVENIIKRKNF